MITTGDDYLHCVDKIIVQLYPLMTHVLKFEYVKPQNFEYGTTVECAKKLTHS